MKKFKAVLFDLDGTLVDSLRDIAESVNAVLKHYGFPIHPIENYKAMVGDGMPILVKRALPADKRDDTKLEEYVNKINMEYTKNWNIYTKPYPGIENLLNKIQSMNIPMAIFSNKPDDLTQLTVSGILKDYRFEEIIGLKNGIPKKPDPAGAFLISQKTGIAANEFIYVGDTDTDMKTATAAGMYPVGVLWGFRERDEIVKNGALSVIAKPEELLSFL